MIKSDVLKEIQNTLISFHQEKIKLLSFLISNK
jgi:hypothetical protein